VEVSIEERRTVDGLLVKVGDTVWHDGNVGVRTCKLAKHHLGMWWPWFGQRIYSTERAALTAAIEREKKALKKAKQQERRATKSIERLTARLEIAQ
jgi:hypothetical protein